MKSTSQKYREVAKAALLNPSDDNIVSVEVATAFLKHDDYTNATAEMLLEEVFVEAALELCPQS